MMLRFLFSALVTVVLLSACSTEKPTEGFVDVEGGKVWYKRLGNGGKTPLLVMHGGPGSGCCRMIPGFEEIAKDREVILYDQLGAGRSDESLDTALWTVEHFVSEVDDIREALGLEEVHLLGHSWGGALLAAYMTDDQPKGVKSVTFSSPLISSHVWMRDAKALLKKMPKAVQDTINKYEALEDYDNQAYKDATVAFYRQHVTRGPWPPVRPSSCDGVKGTNGAIYSYMWGPTEFNATGTLKNFDRMRELALIDGPILFVTGQYDEAKPETMYAFQKLCNNAEVEIIEGAAHFTSSDNPEGYTAAVSGFLKKWD